MRILAALNMIAQGASSIGQVGPLSQAVASDMPASFAPDTVHPLQMTSEGRLRVSAVMVDNQSAWGFIGRNPYEQSNPFKVRNPYV